jgi:hypothetical protein
MPSNHPVPPLAAPAYMPRVSDGTRCRMTPTAQTDSLPNNTMAVHGTPAQPYGVPNHPTTPCSRNKHPGTRPPLATVTCGSSKWQKQVAAASGSSKWQQSQSAQTSQGWLLSALDRWGW